MIFPNLSRVQLGLGRCHRVKKIGFIFNFDLNCFFVTSLASVCWDSRAATYHICLLTIVCIFIYKPLLSYRNQWTKLSQHPPSIIFGLLLVAKIISGPSFPLQLIHVIPLGNQAHLFKEIQKLWKSTPDPKFILQKGFEIWIIFQSLLIKYLTNNKQQIWIFLH